MNLVVDIGNSSVKAAIFEGGRLVKLLSGNELAEVKYDRAIVVSTRGEKNTVLEFKNALLLDHSTPVPLKNLYRTPETLGYDRLAAAVGAHTMFPDRTALVVDFGTAITLDIVTAAGEFVGGTISAGAGMRFRALHEFTGKLPLCGLPKAETETEIEAENFPARDTKSALQNGVDWGIVAEIEEHARRAREKFGEIVIIFTGGDADYFAGRVKFPIFAVSDLVFRGLNAILEHNAIR
jgi:type III pantothenate kinase